MPRPRIRLLMLLQLGAVLLFLVGCGFAARDFFRHSGDSLVRLESGEWVRRSAYDAQLQFGLEMLFCSVMIGVGIAGLLFLSRDYLWEIQGDKFSHLFQNADLDKTLRIGPIHRLKGNGLTMLFRYEPSWKPQQSFRLNPPSLPLMSYHVRLLGQESEKEVILQESKFQHLEQNDDGAVIPKWKEQNLSVESDFSSYFLEIDLSITPNPALWPVKEKKRATSSTPTVLFEVEIVNRLRRKERKSWRSSVSSSFQEASFLWI